jgi:tetratricopeptide (TPR) repeat protein
MFTRRPRRALVTAVAATLMAAAIVLACSPQFPISLIRRDDDGVHFVPRPTFAREMRSAFAPARARDADDRDAAEPAGRRDAYDRSAEIDVAAVRASLAGAGHDASAIERLMRDYVSARQLLATARRAADHARERGEPPPAPEVVLPDLPDAIALQYRLHLRGLVLWTQGDPDAARSAWTQLLELPADERRDRAAWAAYMLGRSFVGDDPARAAEWFQRCRDAVAAGAPDPLQLARESLGWQARAALDAGDFAAAIRGYVEHFRADDPTAVASLRTAAARAIGSDDATLATLARDEVCRRVLTAHLASMPIAWLHEDDDVEAERHARWLDALASLQVRDLPDADRIAWTLYQQGRTDDAVRWLEHADPSTPLACWLRAKLLMRAGDRDAAIAQLARAARAFPADETWDDSPGGVHPWTALLPRDRVLAERGVLELSRGDYVESLRLLLQSGYELDAAYVAERVMTSDELIAFLDREPAPSPWTILRDGVSLATARRDLHRLLTRRLLRERRFDDAVRVAPASLRGRVIAYADAWKAGHDENRSLEDRAAAMVQAARLARHEGLDLLAYELQPDWAIFGGNFENEPIGDGRSPVNEIDAATTLELQRVDATPVPTHRWHYRHLAADLAWDASYFMPNESDATAEWLREAGMWLAPKDPKSAERFYKALVRRCGTTALGQEADRLRWFPPKKKRDRAE